MSFSIVASEAFSKRLLLRLEREGFGKAEMKRLGVAISAEAMNTNAERGKPTLGPGASYILGVLGGTLMKYGTRHEEVERGK